MLDILKVIILGIVEGITEWLPISSTGHLILFGSLLKPGFSDAFTEMFDVVIQFGAIMAVFVIFFKKIWPFHTKKHAPLYSQFVNSDYEGAFGKVQRFADNYLYMDKFLLWTKIFVSSMPTLLLYVLFNDWMEEHLHKPIPVAIMLILYGGLFILIEYLNRGKRPHITKLRNITYRLALFMGLFQALSLVPGTSRSGAVIIGGLILGFSRTMAAEYCFFMGIPAMVVASLVKLFDFGLNYTGMEFACLILGMAVSFVVSMVCIRFLMGFVKHHTFSAFGVYRIVLGLAVIIASAAGII